MLLEFLLYISLLISSLFLISRYITHNREPLNQRSSFTDKLIYGGTYGMIGIGLMVVHHALEKGFFDPRQIAIILAFFYGGWIPALISSALIFIVRATILTNGVNIPILLVGMISTLVIAQLITRFITDRSKQWYVLTIVTLFEIYFFLWVRDQPTPYLNPDFIHFAFSYCFGSIFAYHFTESLRNSHRVMAELKHSQEELQRSETNYRLIAEHSSDLISVLTVDGRALYLSPSHDTVLGFDHIGNLGKTVLPLIHPDDLPDLLESYREAIRKRESSQIEYRFQHKMGFWVWIESQYVPIIGDDGEIEKIVVTSRDVTERKQTEEIIRNTEKLSVVGELAAGIAHEIRNPLTTLKGFIQFMKEDPGSSSNTFFDIMFEELNRIDLITNELLYLAKPQAKEIKEVEIGSVLEQTKTLLEPQAILHNVVFTLQMEENLPNVMGMDNRLKQVMINLLKNAIEAMPLGGEIQVEVKKENEDTLLISVKDQGMGIPEDRIDKLGQPFYSLKEKGTGLGLTVCKKIIQEHSGKITFHSLVGAGTTVEIRLPLAISSNTSSLAYR